MAASLCRRGYYAASAQPLTTGQVIIINRGLASAIYPLLIFIMKYCLIFLLVILSGCYEPPDLPLPVALEYSGLIVIGQIEIPDPNGKYYIPEWDDPFFRLRYPTWDGKYRYMRQLVKSE